MPWSEDDSSGEERDTGFAIPYGGDSPSVSRDGTVSFSVGDEFTEPEAQPSSVDLPPRIVPLFHPADTVRGCIRVKLKGETESTTMKSRKLCPRSDLKFFILSRRTFVSKAFVKIYRLMLKTKQTFLLFETMQGSVHPFACHDKRVRNETHPPLCVNASLEIHKFFLHFWNHHSVFLSRFSR